MGVRVHEDWKNILFATGIEGKLPLTLFVTPGNEYTVYGLSCHSNSNIQGAEILCDVVDDHGNLVSAPIDAFGIVDATLPSQWRVEIRERSVVFYPYSHSAGGQQFGPGSAQVGEAAFLHPVTRHVFLP